MISTTFSTTQATGTIHHCIMPWSSTCRVSQQLNAMVWPRELPSIRLPTARRVLPSFESSSMHPKGTKQTELRPSLQRNWSYWNHMILHDIRIRNHLQSEIICIWSYGIRISIRCYIGGGDIHQGTSLWSTLLQAWRRWWGCKKPKTTRILVAANQLWTRVKKDWTWKMWRMSNNDILSKLSKLSKLSRAAGPCDSWQSCRCDGTSNGGTSHRLQGERHPLQPLWTLFFTLSWKFPSVRSA